ncbi:MAG: glycogen debranching protein GlgX [Alteromonadaceae bacterium]|nr:glycogen debranching protein GlgX [Alteromonadaceae bacterium]
MNSASNSRHHEVDLGQPFPLGATVTATGCNFAVTCTDARAVILCLFHADTEEVLDEIVMPAKSADVWHAHVKGLNAGQLYGYRVERGEENLHNTPTDKLLIDPYARQLSRPLHWNARQYSGDSQFMMAKCVVTEDTSVANEDRPPKPDIPRHRRILYEAHVKGLTKQHADVPAAQQGKYLGACHPVILQHLKALGITSVQFMPLAAFMPEPYITEKGLTNYWGYNPVNYFAPEPRYGQTDPLAECRTMVDEYHRAGLEVIVDVVYNHTAEGGADGPLLSFRGMFPHQAYLMEQTAKGKLVYSNHSGCGNTVYSAHPIMTTMIMDALRYWLTDIGVDGFRFDLAACLGRDPQQFSVFAGLLRAINQDPQLKSAVLIAEPWDIGPGGYQLGTFGSRWLECNDKFRDSVRAFWRGDKGTKADFATRLMGSRDVFHKGYRNINTSVNNVTYHDGFTLQDLVSYAERHNEANGEENRDGHGHNLSANYGVEGPTNDKAILARREQQKRNLFATLLFSQGTPHILGGDELSRTQQGNNNAYCQDNEISWFDWDLNKYQQDFLAYCSHVISIRQQSELLSRMFLSDDSYQLHANVLAVNWYNPDGSDKDSDDWDAQGNKAFAVEIVGHKNTAQEPEHWLLCFNASDRDVKFNTRLQSHSGGWSLVLDTRYSHPKKQPQLRVQHLFLQAKQSFVLFRYTELPL